MPMVIGALKRLDLLRSNPEFKEKLWTIVNALQTGLVENGLNIGATQSPVTPVILNGDVAEATQITYDLRENYNIFCSIIIYPVIPKGMIILRIIPTAVHTLDDVEYTVKTFATIKRKLENKEYSKEFKERTVK
jgi:glycine C-acetyltransferase